MSFKDLTPRERITACHIAFMRDPEFARLGGVTQIGKVEITDISTAATNGADCYYGEKFIMGLSQQQLRFVVAHENLHKAYHHCTNYQEIVKKYPRESNMAMDYIVNRDVFIMDGGRDFIAATTDPTPLLDAKYKDHSWLEVLKDLLEQGVSGQPPQGGGKPGQGQGQPGQGGGTLDEHIQAEPGSGETEAGKALAQQIQDAVNQGRIVADKLRGQGKGGAKLSGFQERKTDWRTPLRKFISELCEGDEFSRFNPPNRRFIAHDIVMPSHFSESTGELVVACDTSGSMTGVLPLVFGEVARICQQVLPESVRVVWWSDGIEGVQRFTAKDYASIAKLMAPKGGGGTEVSCVARYIAQERIKAKATIILTDGYIGVQSNIPTGPLLWGVVDNSSFVAARGKVLHLSSMSM